MHLVVVVVFCWTAENYAHFDYEFVSFVLNLASKVCVALYQSESRKWRHEEIVYTGLTSTETQQNIPTRAKAISNNQTKPR